MWLESCRTYVGVQIIFYCPQQFGLHKCKNIKSGQLANYRRRCTVELPFTLLRSELILAKLNMRSCFHEISCTAEPSEYIHKDWCFVCSTYKSLQKYRWVV